MIFWAGSAWQRHTPQHTNSTQHTDNKTLTTGERDKRQRTETETRTEGQRGGKEDGYGCCSCYLLSYWLTDFTHLLLFLTTTTTTTSTATAAANLRITITLFHWHTVTFNIDIHTFTFTIPKVKTTTRSVCGQADWFFLGAVSQINLRTRSPAKRLP